MTERRWAPAAWPWQRMQIGAAPDLLVPPGTRFVGAICAQAGHTSCRSVRIVSKSTVRFHFATTIPGWNPFESERKMRGFSRRETKGSLESVLLVGHTVMAASAFETAG